MGFEIPTDLIRQLRISLRNDAGLSSYDPHPSPLPPLQESVSGFDPSPPNLRCEHCKCRLATTKSNIAEFGGNQISISTKISLVQQEFACGFILIVSDFLFSGGFKATKSNIAEFGENRISISTKISLVQQEFASGSCSLFLISCFPEDSRQQLNPTLLNLVKIKSAFQQRFLWSDRNSLEVIFIVSDFWFPRGFQDK
ncbi:hypothetical protein LOK49_LG02G00176 [Camellia lanceoleosa]|uniref:Uncharacterized protein n=1 Tax=Camellia lanceoleosa TaxID=1840588 RepID=A0ACC0IRF4_9ERIC|nr:hypothetical protein LOK49_LG02G00176 [Camellia lanceoleosa]